MADLFKDKRWKFKGGACQIQTEFPYYEPGQTCCGKFFVHIEEECETTKVVLEIKGKETNKFRTHHTESIPIPKHNPEDPEEEQ